MMRHFGVIDLGSNSARLSVWQINEDSSVKQVLKLKEMVRLSEGMGEDRVLARTSHGAHDSSASWL
jgi:exopolyphosphatase/guanosine-5'-triphosphate,3'-diphosphate pyrophosphatase